MSELSKAIKRHNNPFQWIALFLWIIICAPLIETYLFPVMGDLRITGIRSIEGGSLVSAQAEKKRNCSWRKTKWYFGDRYGLNVPLLSAEYRSPPRVREKGTLYWENIFVPLTEDQIMNNAFADTFHVCYFSEEYRTKSKFWR